MSLFLSVEVHAPLKISTASYGLACLLVTSNSYFWLLFNTYSLFVFLFYIGPSVTQISVNGSFYLSIFFFILFQMPHILTV